jgi:predicted phage terminase large subunit-like protein
LIDVPTPSESSAERKALRQNARRALAQRIRARREAKVRALEKLRAPKARARFSEFVRQAWPILHPGTRLEWNWHLDVICDHAQALAGYLLKARDAHERGKHWDMPEKDLLVNVPPRSLKTELLGVFFLAWLWLKDPSLHMRYVSGSDKMRTLTSRMVSDIVNSTWYRESFAPGWSIRSDADAIGMFKNSARGLAVFATYAESVTGEGYDVTIIDDPIDAKKAHSDAERNTINSNWDHAHNSRLKDRLRYLRIGIMQRLHEDDWSAHVLAKGNWRHVCIPTEYERRDVEPYPCPCADCRSGKSFLGPYDFRQEGELLHPARMDDRWLEAEKRIGSMYFAGQHQQRPAPAEGGMFQHSWWKYYDPADLPRLERILIAVDCNYIKTATGSRTAIIAVGQSRQYRYVLDVVVRSMDPPEMAREVIKMRDKYPKSLLYIEEKAAGGPVLASLRDAGVGGIKSFNPGRDSKESRAASIVGIVEAGDVLLPKGAPWLDAFLHELGTFPNGKHDDQVDALSMALGYFRGASSLTRTHW